MYDYDSEAWAKMLESTINKHSKRLHAIDFWVEPLELFDRSGNVYSQLVPKVAISFK